MRSDTVDTTVCGARDRLLDDAGAALAQMALDEVAAKFWPADEGWTVRSVEPGFLRVLYVAEHPVYGIGASLIQSASEEARIALIRGGAEADAMCEGDQTIPTPAVWLESTQLTRIMGVQTALHAQASSRWDLLGLFLERDNVGRFSGDEMRMFAFLLESPVFMDDTIRTLVALNPAFDTLIAQTRRHWERLSPVFGVRRGGMFSPLPA